MADVISLAEGIYRAITKHGSGVFTLDGAPFENHGEGMFLVPAANKVHTLCARIESLEDAQAAAEYFALCLDDEVQTLLASGEALAFVISYGILVQVPDDAETEISVANITASREDASVLAALRGLTRYFDITNDTWISCKMERCA